MQKWPSDIRSLECDGYSLGTTTAIALAIMLLVGNGTTNSLHIVGMRFLNVMYGIVVAILVTRFVWKKS